MLFKGNIKKLYWISLFHSLIPAYVIERLFWQARGMNVAMVVYCEIIYALIVTVGEIPSGILADKFGRKRLLIIDSILSAMEILLLLTAHHFWQFAAATCLAGVGRALSSGSENALLYDSLLNENRQNDFEKIAGRISVLDFGGSIVAALSGSVLAHFFNYEFNYIVSAFSLLAAFAVTLFLREPPMLTRPENETASALPYLKQAWMVFKSQPLVLIYALTGAVLGACLIYLDEFWQLLLENIGVPVLFFGIVSALTLFFRIPGNLFAYKLKDKFSYKTILTGIIGASGIGYAAIFLTQNFYCFIPMVVIAMVSGILEPLIAGYLHHRTESHIRATVESFSSVGLRVASMLVGLLFGYISKTYSLFGGFLALGLICFVLMLLFRWGSRLYNSELNSRYTEGH